jgi:hypothetical protein
MKLQLQASPLLQKANDLYNFQGRAVPDLFPDHIAVTFLAVQFEISGYG